MILHRNMHTTTTHNGEKQCVHYYITVYSGMYLTPPRHPLPTRLPATWRVPSSSCISSIVQPASQPNSSSTNSSLPLPFLEPYLQDLEAIESIHRRYAPLRCASVASSTSYRARTLWTWQRWLWSLAIHFCKSWHYSSCKNWSCRQSLQSSAWINRS